jgi:NAD(P)H-hydrate repair Nnr-like enzyme with NAD(P)H-hydrate epimerase domain
MQEVRGATVVVVAVDIVVGVDVATGAFDCNNSGLP